MTRPARNTLAFALAALFGAAAPARVAADVLTLDAAERAALGDRAVLRADAAASRSARADVDKAESAYMPHLTLEAETGVSPGRKLIELGEGEDAVLVSGSRKLGQSGAFDPQVRNSLELELKGNLYDFGRTRAAVEASRARSAAVAAERAVTEHAIVEAVRAGYLRWLGSFELLVLAGQSASDAAARRTRVQALIAEGVRPAADLTPAQADEALAALELERARGDVRAARLALEQAIGAALPDGAEPDRALLDRHASLDPAPATAANAQTAVPAGTADRGSAAGGDPAEQALALQAAAARASADAADKSDAPALSGALSAGLYGQNLSPFPSYAVGIGLSVPLWDGGTASATADAARARAAELDARKQAQSQSERERRARAALDGENAANLLRAALGLQAICDRQLHEAEQAYELGAAGIEPIAQARGARRRAQTEVVLARLARVEAALALRRGP